MLFDEMSQIAKNVASQRMSSNMPLTFNDTICVAYTANNKIYVGLSSTKMVNNMPMAYHAEIDLCNNLMAENDTAVSEISLFNAATFQPVLPCSECASRIMGMNPYNVNTLFLLPTQNVALSQMGAYIQSQNQMSMASAAPVGQGMPMQNMGGYQGVPYQGMYPQNMGYPGGMPAQYAAPVQPAAPAPVQPVVQNQYAAPEASRTESMYLAGEDKDDGEILKSRLNKLFSVEDEPDINDLKAQKAQEKAAQKKKFKLF